MNKENNKYHFYWIIAVLVAVIIYLITVKLGENTQVVGLINFGSTLTSLVLAVLAIVYAFISNSSVSQSMGKLSDASSEISDTAKEVSEAAKELKGKIEAIPTKLESMEVKFDQMLLLGQTSEPHDIRSPNKEEREASSEIVDLFVEKISFAGWLAVYAFFLAYKRKKNFEYTSLFDSVKYVGNQYGYGILVTMKAVGLLDFTVNNYTITAISLNKKLHTYIEKRFEELYNNLYEATWGNSDEDQRKRAKIATKDSRNSIEKYFNE